MSSPNIAIVVLDTLRKDAFDEHFQWVPGTRFENTYSTSHWTIPAHASLLTGSYPDDVGVHSKSLEFDTSKTSLPEMLEKEDYNTRLWTTNSHLSHLGGWDKGFNEFLKRYELNPKRNSVKWDDPFDGFIQKNNQTGILRYCSAITYAIKSEKDTIYSLWKGLNVFLGKNNKLKSTRNILKRVEETEFGEKEFLMLNLMDAHVPHYLPKKPGTGEKRIDFNLSDSLKNEVKQPEQKKKAYYNSVKYLSKMYKDIFQELQNDFEIIITVSDHGESLGEHGLWGHGYGLHPELVHIPLVISSDEDLFEKKTRNDITSILDIYQTVAGLVNQKTESSGRDLINQKDSEERFTEYHGLHPGFKEKCSESDMLEKLEKPLKGFIVEEGYCYQNFDEIIVNAEGLSKDFIKDKLDNSLNQRLNEKESIIKEKLRKIGYHQIE